MEVTEPDHEGVAEQHFALLLGAAVALGAAIRFAYVLTDTRRLIGGDGLEYHFEALRFADGHPYTSMFVSAAAPTAYHPPGWVTLLGVISWLGGRSWLTHQLVGVVVGLGVVVLAGLVGRRYFSARVGFVAAVILCGLVISPWTISNSGRLKEPVILSTTGGGQLVAGNCPPFTYSGTYLGYYGGPCWLQAVSIHPGLDASQVDSYNRGLAVRNIKANLDKLPVTVPARFGRLLAVFRPSQTVAFTAAWMTTDNRPIWAWVVSYWALLPLALVGAVHARRSRKLLLPLLAPLVVVDALVAISYGEPRYHTPADLGVVVLGAAGADRVLARLGRYRGAIRTREAVRTSDTATHAVLQ